jgi:dipeptidase D
MDKQLSSLEPNALWRNFEKLCSFPRPSKKEQKVVEYIISFAQEHNLKYKTDETGNVVIEKPATPGFENRQKVVLQAHLDMVPQKNASTVHDFEKDPIQAYIDGDWVKARGTTLGADNGIGVAAAMAVLTASDLQHGPVEAFFTIDEETGMTGAFNLKKGFISGDILLNLDSEEEGELCIGCAGGVNSSAYSAYKQEVIPAGMKAFKLNLTGLKGGHSGIDINLGRANANKIMTRFLYEATAKNGLRICSMEGGNLRNAIPREAFAEVVVPESNADGFINDLAAFEKVIQAEFTPVETSIQFTDEVISTPKNCMAATDQEKFLNAVYAMPNGTIRMSQEVKGIVETSTNLSIVKVENGKMEIKSLLRSSVESGKADLLNTAESVYKLAGMQFDSDGSYPGWKPDVHSPILQTMKEVYHKNFGKEPEVKVIHAGLECGIIGSVEPKLDMVSFGPTICHPHSPDEKVNIPSVAKFWKYLTLTLLAIPVKK